MRYPLLPSLVLRPDVVALMLPRLLRLLHEVATEGPETPGWTQRSAPCPRAIPKLNVTETCCLSNAPPIKASSDEVRTSETQRQARRSAHNRNDAQAMLVRRRRNSVAPVKKDGDVSGVQIYLRR